jgi:hypothetical protein
LGHLRKNKIECFRKLQDAQIAQIRGGFINCDAIICGSGDEVRGEIARCASVHFLEKTEHIYYINSFKLFFTNFIILFF